MISHLSFFFATSTCGRYFVKLKSNVKIFKYTIIPNLIKTIGPLRDPVALYGINYTGTQITQWDFQNKGKSGWTGASAFVLEVPLRNLRPSVIYSIPCDRIVQRAYYSIRACWI